MKKILLIALLLISASHLFAQTELTLTNASSVNSQILADRAGGSPADVYIAPSGSILYWDATLQVDFDLVVRGESTEWIGRQTSPAVFVPIPDAGGALFSFAAVNAGSITLENILMSGQNSINSTEVIIAPFILESGATNIILDNCAFVDLDFCVVRTQGGPDLVSITNCMMINSHNLRDRPWGGHFGRFDIPAALTVMENNTYVNHGRLLGNGGNFYEMDFIENHITSVNCQTNAQNLHWNQALMSNNIFYNWSWLGKTPADVAYNYSITTFETFAGLALDSVSVYFGRNLLYRDPAIQAYYDNELYADVSGYITWNLDVDSTISADDNFTIGKNYWDIDPGFVTPTDNLDKMLAWLSLHYDSTVTEWTDWRSPSPVTYDAGGQPVVSWPPAFDLSYTQEHMLVGGTDGLPMGDLNWFPEAKATYDANRESYIAALVDSITMATALYIPGDSLSERITMDDLVSVESNIYDVPNKYYLENNYPNPFNPSTSIKFGLPQQSKVTLSVYNVIGQKVFELTENELASGTHSFNFDASNLSSGVYVYTISATGFNGQNFVDSKKMMLLK